MIVANKRQLTVLASTQTGSGLTNELITSAIEYTSNGYSVTYITGDDTGAKIHMRGESHPKYGKGKFNVYELSPSGTDLLMMRIAAINESGTDMIFIDAAHLFLCPNEPLIIARNRMLKFLQSAAIMIGKPIVAGITLPNDPNTDAKLREHEKCMHDNGIISYLVQMDKDTGKSSSFRKYNGSLVEHEILAPRNWSLDQTRQVVHFTSATATKSFKEITDIYNEIQKGNA